MLQSREHTSTLCRGNWHGNSVKKPRQSAAADEKLPSHMVPYYDLDAGRQGMFPYVDYRKWLGRVPSVLVITSILLSCLPSNSQLENILSFRQAAAEDSQTTVTIESAVQQEKVVFPTEDGVSIVGTYYFPSIKESGTSAQNETSSALPAAILLHMLGKDRNSWGRFPETLAQKGFVVLAIDLRGHGESVVQYGKPISYQSFTSEDFSKMSLDARAAKRFLTESGSSNSTVKNGPKVDPNRIAIVGASIGANVAVNYAASDPTVSGIVLLSPGLDYKGVRTFEAIKLVKSPVLIITAKGDSIARDGPQQLCAEIRCGDENFQVYQGSTGHGTELLADSALIPPSSQVIITWLDAHVIPEFGTTSLMLTAATVIVLVVVLTGVINRKRDGAVKLSGGATLSQHLR
jgi:dienelactone hydrolase